MNNMLITHPRSVRSDFFFAHKKKIRIRPDSRGGQGPIGSVSGSFLPRRENTFRKQARLPRRTYIMKIVSGPGAIFIGGPCRRLSHQLLPIVRRRKGQVPGIRGPSLGQLSKPPGPRGPQGLGVYRKLAARDDHLHGKLNTMGASVNCWKV